MGTSVLVPIDGSEQAWRAYEFAVAEFPDAEFVLLHVIDPARGGHSADGAVPSFSPSWYETAEQEAEELFEAAEELATERDVTVETAIVVGKPTREIVDYAGEHGIDHIVMGSHGRSGVSRILLGSVAETVVRNAPVPVTVAR